MFYPLFFFLFLSSLLSSLLSLLSLILSIFTLLSPVWSESKESNNSEEKEKDSNDSKDGSKSDGKETESKVCVADYMALSCVLCVVHCVWYTVCCVCCTAECWAVVELLTTVLLAVLPPYVWLVSLYTDISTAASPLSHPPFILTHPYNPIPSPSLNPPLLLLTVMSGVSCSVTAGEEDPSRIEHHSNFAVALCTSVLVVSGVRALRRKGLSTIIDTRNPTLSRYKKYFQILCGQNPPPPFIVQ